MNNPKPTYITGEDVMPIELAFIGEYNDGDCNYLAMYVGARWPAGTKCAYCRGFASCALYDIEDKPMPYCSVCIRSLDTLTDWNVTKVTDVEPAEAIAEWMRNSPQLFIRLWSNGF